MTHTSLKIKMLSATYLNDPAEHWSAQVRKLEVRKSATKCTLTEYSTES
jgi:hypothetical protein